MANNENLYVCLDPASTALVAAQSAKNQTVTYVPRVKDYDVNATPNYPNTTLSNPTSSNQTNSNGEGLVAFKNKLLTAKEIYDFIKNSPGNLSKFVWFIKELQRTDVVHHARVAKLFKAVVLAKKIPVADILLASVNTALGDYLIKNSSEAFKGFKIIGQLMSDPKTRDIFLNEIHQQYGGMSWKEALGASAKEGMQNNKMLATSILKALDNLTGNATGNMIEVFQGGDPISRMEKEFDDLFNSIKSFFK